MGDGQLVPVATIFPALTGAIVGMLLAFRGLERGPTWLMFGGWFGAVLCGAVTLIAAIPWLLRNP